MAITMTKAEYQKKYGTLPPQASLPSPKAAALPQAPKPAPVQMTKAEYQAKYGITPEQGEILNREAPNPGEARDKILESLKADTRSAEAYRPAFPAAIGTDSPVKSVAKTVGNLPSSGIGLVGGMLHVAKDVATLPISISSAIGSQISQGREANNLAKKNEEIAAKDKELTARFIATTDPAERELIRKQLIELRGQVLPVPKQEAPTKNTVLNIGQAIAEPAVSRVKENVTGFDQGTPTTDNMKAALIERYGSLDNLQRTAVNDPAGFATDILAILEGGAALAGKSKQLNTILSKTAQTSVIKPATVVADVSKGAIESYQASKAAKNLMKADELAGRVIQGKPEDIPRAVKPLSQIDTAALPKNAGAKEVGAQLDAKIAADAERVDAAYRTVPDVKPLDSFSKTTNGVKINAVEDAISQIKDYYRSTKDAAGLGEITRLESKAAASGLTAEEVNQLAKLHGQLRKGFNLNGELSSGLNKQAFENTRKGVKTAARDLLADPAARKADLELSDTMNTRELIGDLEDAANKLRQKTIDPTMSAKIGARLGQVINFASGGLAKGFVDFFVRRGATGTTLNAIKLDEMIVKNIKEMQKLLDGKYTESEAASRLDAIIKTNEELMKELQQPSRQLPAGPAKGEPGNPLITPRRGEGVNQPPAFNEAASRANDARIAKQAAMNELQKEMTGMTERFKTKDSWLRSANSNPALLKKIESAGTTPEGLWDINKVNAQKAVISAPPQKTYYHGTNAPDAIMKDGFSVGKDAQEGSSFLGDNFVEGVHLSKTKKPYAPGGQLEDVSKVLDVNIDAKNVLKTDLKGIGELYAKYGIDEMAPDHAQKLTDELIKAGYDGIEYGDETVIFDPKKVRVVK